MTVGRNTTAVAIVRGQRWMSDAEPELGLGIVIDVDDRTVVLEFAEADETRRYAFRSAPLRRVRFAVGDVVAGRKGERFEVAYVEERDGLLIYHSAQGTHGAQGTRGVHGGGLSLPESQVSGRVALTGARERLLAGRVDPPAVFDLRLETLENLHRIRKSPIRGIVGPRLELIAHQFFIAHEVTSRRRPRVLLADQTGLGKTIEACLILNRMLATGRAARVLVVVPDSLVNQWLVELRRRFQLRFAVYDEERCQAVESGAEVELVTSLEEVAAEIAPGVAPNVAPNVVPNAVPNVVPNVAPNPFESEQLVLTGSSLFSGSERRSTQAATAGWDVVVVDEAHHLVWNQGEASEAYRAIERIAAASDGLILLSATPEQLGEESHFARLRLLDPDRYESFESWRAEAEEYRAIARIAERLLNGDVLSPEEQHRLAVTLELDPQELVRRLGDDARRRRVIDELIDRHGPGRVMFRNTRAVMKTFPRRETRLERLPACAHETAVRVRMADELHADLSGSGRDDRAYLTHLAQDPRVGFLVDVLRTSAPQKLLVICRSAAKAQAVKAAIEASIKVDVALFHEGLTLVQRDRNAAWFASEDGARVLVCSEIGSEGRNFQHAQTLVMFDLPLDPDLVEQRIGRVDRIGQRGTVRVLVPFLGATGLEVVARWHHEGVGVFDRPTLTGFPLLERYGERVRALALAAPQTARSVLENAVDEVISETAATARVLAERVDAGRDRLLEIASLRADVADALIRAITAAGKSRELEDYFLRLLESFHIYAEEIGPRTYRLNPDAMRSTEFPSLERGETAVTFDRDTALVREDFALVTADHPLLGDAMELLLATESGNASFAVAETSGAPRLILQAVFVLESVAPARLHVDRFLPATPLRVAVEQGGADVGSDANASIESSRELRLSESDVSWLTEHIGELRPALGSMLARSHELAEALAARARAGALSEIRESLGAELERLRALAKKNDHVRPEEIEDAVDECAALERHVAESRLRIDAVRLVLERQSSED